MYEYQFPRMRGSNDYSMERFTAQMLKVWEEASEASEAATVEDTAMELFDVIHAAETALRMLSHSQYAEEYAEDTEGGGDALLATAYERVIAKNAERGYYPNAEGWV